MEVQECEAKITKEDSSVEKTKVVSDELSESTNSCLFSSLVCNPLSNDAPVPISTKIQVTPTNVHVFDSDDNRD